jgi:hypothetical protein
MYSDVMHVMGHKFLLTVVKPLHLTLSTEVECETTHVKGELFLAAHRECCCRVCSEQPLNCLQTRIVLEGQVQRQIVVFIGHCARCSTIHCSNILRNKYHDTKKSHPRTYTFRVQLNQLLNDVRLSSILNGDVEREISAIQTSSADSTRVLCQEELRH